MPKGARSRHPKRAPLRDMSVILQKPPIILLRLYVCVGRRGRFPSSIPEIHVLPRHGYCAVQPLPLVLAPRAVEEIVGFGRFKGLVDSTDRNHLYGRILVRVRILPLVAHAPRLANPTGLCPGVPYHDDAPSCSDYAVALGYVHLDSPRGRVISPATASHHHGRRLPRLA